MESSCVSPRDGLFNAAANRSITVGGPVRSRKLKMRAAQLQQGVSGISDITYRVPLRRSSALPRPRESSSEIRAPYGRASALRINTHVPTPLGLAGDVRLAQAAAR
jgi:hypothetical protein